MRAGGATKTTEPTAGARPPATRRRREPRPSVGGGRAEVVAFPAAITSGR